MNQIKAGYRITVESWENDADNYRTVIIDGLTEEQTKFYVELANLHKSVNHNRGCFGNMYEPSKSEIAEYEKALQSIAVNHIPALKTLNSYFEESWLNESSSIHDFIYCTLVDNLGLTGGDFYTRVTASVAVHLVPVTVYFQDVTSDFI